jgi:hypothetical protein
MRDQRFRRMAWSGAYRRFRAEEIRRRHWWEVGRVNTVGTRAVGAFVLGALIGFAAGNGHTTKASISSLSDRLGQTQAWAKCEDHRADQAKGVAKQAIKGALVWDERVPSTSEIPRDCPHPK